MEADGRSDRVRARGVEGCGWNVLEREMEGESKDGSAVCSRADVAHLRCMDAPDIRHVPAQSLSLILSFSLPPSCFKGPAGLRTPAFPFRRHLKVSVSQANTNLPHRSAICSRVIYTRYSSLVC